MSLISDPPAWLEHFRPDDALYADAYESTPAELRALLKTAIAFSFHRWKPDREEPLKEIRSLRAGFFHKEASRPASWVLAMAGTDFASPARLIAALIPAVIAGTTRIFLLSPAPFAPAVSTALELAGLEDSFVLDDDRAADLYEDLRASSADGRVIVFPGGDGSLSPGQKDLLHRASIDGISTYRDLSAPKLLSLYPAASSEASGNLTAEDMKARLRWLYPDAVLCDEPSADVNAVFVPDGVSPQCSAPLTLGPGMEACWMSLDPEFFRTRTLSAFLVQENPS